MQSTRRRVLVVDDHAPLLDTLRTLLQDFRYDVACCGSGVEAIEELSRRPYDVVLMDYQMPGLTGAEAFRRLRPHHPGACFIGMSADDREQAFLAAGADAFVSKWDVDTLPSIVLRHHGEPA